MSLLGGWGNFLISKLAAMTWGVLRTGSARTNNDIVIPRRETVSIMARKILGLGLRGQARLSDAVGVTERRASNQGSEIKKFWLTPGPRTSAH